MQASFNKDNIKILLTRYLNIISCRRYLFFSIFASITVISVIHSYTAKKKYKTSETILVEKEKIINPLMNGLALAQSPADRLNTIKQINLSRSRLLQVIKKLDLDLHIKTPLELENLIHDLRKAIEIKLTGKNLYLISFEGDDPEVVKNVTTTICDLFIEENLGETRGEAHGAFVFIENQLNIYRRKLEDSETALRIFKEENLGQLPGEENVNLDKLAQYHDALTRAESELKEAELQKSLVTKQLSGESPLILTFSSSSNNSLESQLVQLNAKLSDLLTRYTEKYPDAIRLMEKIESIKQRIAESNNRKDKSKNDETIEKSTTEALNPIYQKLREDLGQINIKIDLLNSRIAEYKEKIEIYSNKVQSIPTQEQELIRLKRGYDVNASIYKTLLNKLEEARISRALEVNQKNDNFQIIDPAQLPLLPSEPNRPKIILMGAILGLIAASAAIYALQYLDNSIVDQYDARDYFKYPILASIPLVTS
ncbi:MAG: protein tyrosine kinase modulator, partial [Candidatus Poribacteria bacterium]|nr:protein tyrosine kinase modulator [Candidatus Poribacteria bacterium]